jgi:hypothetical protein
VVFQELDAMADGAVGEAKLAGGARKTLQAGDALKCRQRMQRGEFVKLKIRHELTVNVKIALFLRQPTPHQHNTDLPEPAVAGCAVNESYSRILRWDFQRSPYGPPGNQQS